MLRIIEYYAENFKRLRLVEFKPKGRMTIFTGKNDQGKTSALDAVPFVLGGLKYSPEAPMRRGASHFKVKLDLGEFTVQRTSSGLKLEMAPGAKGWATPQAMLDSIFDELAFDPLQFVRMKAPQQVELLRKAVKLDEDLEELTRLNAEDFEARRIINRETTRLTNEIALLPIQSGLPKDKIDTEALAGRLKEINESNRLAAERAIAKQALAEKVRGAENAKQANDALLDRINAGLPAIEEQLNKVKEQQLELPGLRAALEVLLQKCKNNQWVRLHEAIQRASHEAEIASEQLMTSLNSIVAQLSQDNKTVKAARAVEPALHKNIEEARQAYDAAPAGEAIDAAPILDELRQAETINREIDKRNRREALDQQREDKEREARQFTRAMEDREERKRDALAKAKMPVEGLTFNEEHVLFEGIPFQQLGEAQQIRISVQLILARNPKLRLVVIRNGEALDEDSLAELAKMAEELDFYIWMARVDSSGKVGIYLEDGEVKAINEEPANG